MGDITSCLVGYTGFVGSNLDQSFNFNYRYNSKNIGDAYGLNPDLLVYAGVTGTKFLANNNPDKDRTHIEKTIENIKNINPKKLVLISTVDVYKNPVGVDEDSKIILEGLHPYGLNRFYLEEWVQNNYKDHLIVRLPAIYGENLKKNFIYDIINPIPYALNKDVYLKLSLECDKRLLEKCYQVNVANKDYYALMQITDREREELKKVLKKINISTLNFTDSRNIYQFYNLKYLWEHINLCLENNIRLINIATEPLKASEVYKEVFGKEFSNLINTPSVTYNYYTKYARLFSGEERYIFNKSTVLEDLKNFIIANMSEI